MKISSHVHSYDSNVKRYKDFHEIQAEQNELARDEIRSREKLNLEKLNEFKAQELANAEKSRLYHQPYHVVIQKRLNVL